MGSPLDIAKLMKIKWIRWTRNAVRIEDDEVFYKISTGEPVCEGQTIRRRYR
jgi:hypothetical protein